ncbi:hypothetical protein HMPREF0591_0325 [Mycobacterium parascrofulaceum ATCC BAA-614]|jgi:hypothetical protein|uniref:Uncharacterized protein n=1 Tax=Mycobacterium parascrofulaceum ATCC BAA-614 TaxID=525368 RepID=D5P2B8_9MYCO|nr:hypothetical protein HMPREF0591_0325 [Mycobacterium parascrofulaceum ATCC BAA-614]
MTTIQRDYAQHGLGDRGSSCCGRPGRRNGSDYGPGWPVEDTAITRRRTLEEHQRDLEQELADVAEQIRDVPADEPRAGTDARSQRRHGKPASSCLASKFHVVGGFHGV